MITNISNQNLKEKRKMLKKINLKSWNKIVSATYLPNLMYIFYQKIIWNVSMRIQNEGGEDKLFDFNYLDCLGHYNLVYLSNHLDNRDLIN